MRRERVLSFLQINHVQKRAELAIRDAVNEVVAEDHIFGDAFRNVLHPLRPDADARVVSPNVRHLVAAYHQDVLLVKDEAHFRSSRRAARQFRPLLQFRRKLPELVRLADQMSLPAEKKHGRFARPRLREDDRRVFAIRRKCSSRHNLLKSPVF